MNSRSFTKSKKIGYFKNTFEDQQDAIIVFDRKLKLKIYVEVILVISPVSSNILQ